MAVLCSRSPLLVGDRPGVEVDRKVCCLLESGFQRRSPRCAGGGFRGEEERDGRRGRGGNNGGKNGDNGDNGTRVTMMTDAFHLRTNMAAVATASVNGSVVEPVVVIAVVVCQL